MCTVSKVADISPFAALYDVYIRHGGNVPVSHAWRKYKSCNLLAIDNSWHHRKQKVCNLLAQWAWHLALRGKPTPGSEGVNMITRISATTFTTTKRNTTSVQFSHGRSAFFYDWWHVAIYCVLQQCIKQPETVCTASSGTD